MASHYRLEAEIGRGRGGVVFRAVDARTGRRVALKRLDAAEIPGVEVSGLVRLEHPHLVRVLEVGRDGAHAFVAQELVEAGTLATLRKPLAAADLAGLAEQLLAGLAFLHGHRILHGDVKPENIFVAAAAPLQVKLGDFGLARRAVDTERGVTRGSPAFMPPEIIRGDIDDERSDLYALGVTLYEAAFGELPFRAASLPELLRQHLSDTPPRLRAPGDVDARFVSLLRALLEKDPARRPASATAALSRWRGEQAGVPTWVPASLGVLVGRDAELALLLSRLRDSGGVAAIDGPSGIGKTRLLRELAVHAELAGHRVVSWTSDDLVPAAAVAVAGVPALDADALARAVRLRADLGRRKFVLLVDDVERQPEAFRRALAFVLRDVASRPAPGQLACVAGHDAVACVEAALTATGAAPAVSVRLATWETPEIEQAITGLLGAPRLHASLVALVAEATGGAPAGVEQACRRLVASQCLRLASTGELTLVPGTAASQLAGDWVREAVERTPGSDLQVLRTLALLRRPASAALVSTVAPNAAGLDRLCGRGLVRALRSAGSPAFALAHESVRRCVLEPWDVREQRSLHDRIAAGFETGTDAGSAANAAQQALWHRACGSDPERARAAAADLAARASTPLDLLRLAYDAVLALHVADHPARPGLELARIDTMLRMGLYAEVVELSRRALASTPTGDVQRRLRNRCGEALLHQGDIEPALEVLGSASEPTPDPEALALRARALTQVGRFTEALEVCGGVRRHLRPDDPLHAAVADTEVVAWRELERFDAAQAQLEAAIAASGRSDVARRGLLQLRLGQIEQLRGQATRAGELFDLARQDFEASDDWFGAARALAGLGVAQAETGQWTVARESFRSALELCRRLGESLSASNILANLGQLHGVLGQYAPGLDHVAQGIALAERAQLAPTVLRSRIIRAGILSALGLDAAAEPDLRAAETTGNERFRAQALLIRAGAALRREETTPVAAWLDEAKQLFERHAIEDERLRVELARARLDALEGRAPAAATSAARVAAAAVELRLLDLVVEAEMWRAELLSQSADPEAALQAQRACEAAHRLGLQECIWRGERLLGHMAAAAGDRRGSLAHYDACVRTLNDMLADLGPETRSRYLSQPAPRRALEELRQLARA